MPAKLAYRAPILLKPHALVAENGMSSKLKLIIKHSSFGSLHCVIALVSHTQRLLARRASVSNIATAASNSGPLSSKAALTKFRKCKVVGSRST